MQPTQLGEIFFEGASLFFIYYFLTRCFWNQGSFTNYVDKKRWVCVRQSKNINVYKVEKAKVGGYLGGQKNFPTYLVYEPNILCNYLFKKLVEIQTCLNVRMFLENSFEPIMHQYSYIFIFIVVFYLDRNQGQEKKKEKKLRTYFRITSFSLRTFFVYHIGKFFDGSISKCLPMYLFRIESRNSCLGMFIIVQYFNLKFYSDDQRTSFPCGRLEITKGTN